MTDAASFRSFAAWFLGVSAAVAALLMLFVLAADVHGVFGTRVLPMRGLADDQRLSRGGDRLVKGLQLASRIDGRSVVVLGSSRAALGYDPARPELKGLPIYNAGLLNGTMVETAAVARFLLDREVPPARLVWTLDHELFDRPRHTPSDFTASVLGGASAWSGYRSLLLSLDVLDGAWDAVRRRAIPPQNLVTLRGWSRQTHIFDGLAFDWRTFFQTEFAGFLDLARSVRQTGPEERQRSLQTLEITLRGAARRGVPVDLVINPRHVWRLAGTEDFGIWPDLEAWKRQLTALAERVSQDLGAPVRVIDFEEVSPETGAPIPAGTFPRPPGLFFETSHFLPQVGARVLARVLDLPGADASAGAILTSGTVDAHLAGLWTSLAEWRRAHPDEAAYVASAMKR